MIRKMRSIFIIALSAIFFPAAAVASCSYSYRYKADSMTALERLTGAFAGESGAVLIATLFFSSALLLFIAGFSREKKSSFWLAGVTALPVGFSVLQNTIAEEYFCESLEVLSSLQEMIFLIFMECFLFMLPIALLMTLALKIVDQSIIDSCREHFSKMSLESIEKAWPLAVCQFILICSFPLIARWPLLGSGVFALAFAGLWVTAFSEDEQGVLKPAPLLAAYRAVTAILTTVCFLSGLDLLIG